MRRILGCLLIVLGALPGIARAQGLVPNLCGPSTSGPVCVGTGNSQPVELWYSGAGKLRYEGATFFPIADAAISLGDATHRFVDGNFSGTVTAAVFSGAFTGTFGNGTAAAPSITFTSDTDTGIYRSNANELSVTTGGTQRVVINSAGLASPSLTSGRVPIAGTGGLLGDDADLTFLTDTLTATKLSTPTSVTLGAMTLTDSSSDLSNSAGGFRVATASHPIYWAAQEVLKSPANHRLAILSNAETTGFEFKTDTDGTAKFRARGDGSDAAVTAGAATFSGTLTSQSAIALTSGDFAMASASAAYWNGGDIYLNRLAAGVMGLRNDSSHGIGMDVTTDATWFCKTRANADGCTVKANSLTGHVLTSYGTGVSVANVGANSCGTSAATIAGNETSGVITVGATAGTQCRVTFSTAAPTARDCTVTDSSTTIATRATPASTTTHDFFGAFVAGDTVTYICVVR